MAANIVKVYSVGLQGPTGPSGSLAPDNSGSFNITGSLNITGSVTSSFFTGSFYGDGSNLTGTTTNTGSLATTGSNTFIGDQVFSGSLTITGSSAKMVSGLIEIDGKGTGESELGILQEGLRIFRGSSATDRNQNITINYQGGAGNIVAYESNANAPQLRIFLSSSTTNYTPAKFQIGVTSISGSFNVTGSTTLSGSLYVSGGTTGSFTGSFYGDGSGLTGISGGSTKEYGYYNMTTQIGFSTNAYVTTGINTTPSTLSSTFSVSYDNSTGTFSGFTSGKLYELEFTWLTRAASGNSMRFQWEKDGVLIGNNSISDQTSSSEARDQNTAKAAFISDGTEDIKIKCTGATGNAPLGFNGDYSFITIKEI